MIREASARAELVETDTQAVGGAQGTQALESAKAARLRYVSDATPGYKRSKNGKSFIYFAPDGTRIRDAEELRRFQSLAIPPAWRDVWICPLANGHLQATGRDAKGRKQHRYHPRWREIRDESKYDRMVAFARKLPAIRRRVKQDLALPGLPRAKIVATVVRLLEKSMIRVGNDEYARRNHSFGLATLRNRHANVTGAKIQFEFRGKSGVQHTVDVNDRRLARIIRQCQDLPGHELFQYIGDGGERCKIESADVNDYLREVAGTEFSSKDFRTWAGTILTARSLKAAGWDGNQAAATRKIAKAIEAVAKVLGNTRAVCRKCYIHPVVLEAYRDGSLGGVSSQGTTKLKPVDELRADEAAVLALLTQRMKNGKKTNAQAGLRRQLKKSLHWAKNAGASRQRGRDARK
jgi:DNA topoisomerase-1